jgi:hypothetical protein
LDELLTKRAKGDDVFIVYGGLFSNTNPSLVAIDDAHRFLRKLTDRVMVKLINTERDSRVFDNESFSTLDIFSDIHNLYVVKDIRGLDYPFDQIPNLMQLEETEGRPGVLVYNPVSKKHMFVENTISPKHVTFIINNLEDFSYIDNEKYKKDFVHIQIVDSLLEEKKLEVNIALHNINPCSVKHLNSDKVETQENGTTDITDSLSIVDTIYSHIGEDEEVRRQFERVLNVFKK